MLKTMLKALYISDFFIKNKTTLNTLALFYDRLYLHDYFGLWGSWWTELEYGVQDVDPEEEIKLTWDFAGGLDQKTRSYLTTAFKNPFDSFVLKGVAQGFGCQTDKFSPAYVKDWTRQYASFLKSNEILFKEEVLCFCMSMRNPFHPSNRLEGGVKLDPNCPNKQNESSLAKAVQNNKKACLFEQEYHELPLVSDSDEDLVPWDRTKDLLTTALLITAIPTKVPTIASVSPEDILEAREKLRDFLPPFRNEILNAAWEIAKASKEESKDEILNLAKLYYGTRIEPAVSEIESKIMSENTKLFRKLLERGVDKTVLFAKSLDPTEPLSKWDLVASGLKSILDIDQSVQTRAELKSPYEFLVRLPKALRV